MPGHSEDSLPVDDAPFDLIDSICDEFESRWRSGDQAAIEDMLSQSGDQRSALLRYLIPLEWELRMESGEQPDAQEYLGRFPGEGALIAETVRLFGSSVETIPGQVVEIGGTPVSEEALQSFFLNEHGLEIFERIGQGSFGTVFSAREKETDRPVALKIPRDLNRGSMLQRFRREARSLARLDHPGIVSLYSYRSTRPTPFLVMQYVESTNLAEYCRNGSLPQSDAVSIVRKVADALAHAHERGVVHRDVKPSNVLIDDEQNVYLTDFGLALLQEGKDRQTMSGDVLGTVEYMPPEQADGRADVATPASDVYSVGVILFELLSETLPFTGSATSVLYQTRHETPPRVADRVPDIPKPLAAVCDRCLEKNPADRFADASELASALRDACQGIAPQSRPFRRLWRRRRKHILSVAAVIVVIIAAAPLLIRETSNPEGGAPDASLPGWQSFPGAMSDGVRLSEPDGYELPDDVSGVAWLPGTDRLAVSCWDCSLWLGELATKKPPVRCDGHEMPVMCLSAFSDGERVATGSSDGDVRVWTVKDEASEVITTHDTNVVGVAVSPDGAMVVSSSMDGLLLRTDMGGERETEQLDQFPSVVQALCFSPDGKWFVAGGNRPEVRIWNVSDWSRAGQLTPFGFRVTGAAISPDSQTLAISSAAKDSKESAIVIYSLESRNETEIKLTQSPAIRVAFVSNSEIVAGLGNGELRAFDVGTGDQIGRISAHTIRVTGLSWSPEAKILASGSDDDLVLFNKPFWGHD